MLVGVCGFSGQWERGICMLGVNESFVYAGPTVLEVFNTLLRQLRLSVDYELTGSYDGNIGTKIIKAHEERQLQEAVIRTIGECVGGVPCVFCVCVCVGGFARQALGLDQLVQ